MPPRGPLSTLAWPRIARYRHLGTLATNHEKVALSDPRRLSRNTPGTRLPDSEYSDLNSSFGISQDEQQATRRQSLACRSDSLAVHARIFARRAAGDARGKGGDNEKIDSNYQLRKQLKREPAVKSLP